MLFSSYIFILLFLPLTVSGYFLLSRFNHNAGKALLLAASFVFYCYFNISYFWILAGSLLFNFFWGELLHRKRSNFLLWIGILANVALLGYCKYYDFFIENINFIFRADYPLKHILLPLGISFFTFQQISYLADVKAGLLPRKYSLFAYSLFVTFFPQLVAGPIVLPGEMMPQFDDPRNRHPNSRNLSAGAFVFALGLAKKILLADNFAPIVDKVYGLPSPGFMDAWYGAFAYTFQLYFDFSGYCDMAIGIGLMFNILLPVNFSSPYKSANIKEFWRTWHITLGRFLSTFIYKKLGGSKKGEVRAHINLFITFLISGLWHGASYLYVIFGVLNGLAMMIHRLWTRSNRKMPHFAGVITTFLFFTLTLIFFHSRDFAESKRIFCGLVNFDKTLFTGFFEDVSRNNLFLVIAAVVIIFFFPPANSFREKFKPTLFNFLVTLLLLTASLLELNKVSPFIYFNF